jgi:hypothetical protein
MGEAMRPIARDGNTTKKSDSKRKMETKKGLLPAFEVRGYYNNCRFLGKAVL